MNKEQALGQARAILSALAGMLIAFGIKDGNQWEPAIGVAVFAISLAWGLYHKEGRDAFWSVLRKLLNAIGTAAAVYGFLTPEKAEALAGLIGPIIATLSSWKANSNDPTRPDPGLMIPLVMFAMFSLCFLQSGCALHVNPDGSKDVIVYPIDELTIGIYPEK